MAGCAATGTEGRQGPTDCILTGMGAGRNYGWVFTSYGVAGLLGPLLAGVFKDAAAVGGSPIAWMTPFIIAGVACLLGALIMVLTNAAKPLAAPAA